MKDKRKLEKRLEIFLYGIGILILIWNIFWFIKVKIMNDYGDIINVFSFTIGFIILIFYIIIIFMLLLAKWISKKYRKKEISHEQKFSGKVKPSDFAKVRSLSDKQSRKLRKPEVSS